jgi:uncharacterized protein YyaL (SSP411 family)
MLKTVIGVICLAGIICSCTGKKDGNKLANASSPYLQLHADNPVAWYEWGEEALEKAKKENKPLLISIGYSSCHWCHVMEKESFMDTAVARVMNENFINIKVDREERPDIDNIYMKACQLLTGGSAGWPLNAFALPDGKPFFAGTYYTKASWLGLLKQITQAYKEKNDLVVKQAESLTRGIVDEESSLSLPVMDSAKAGFSKESYQALFDSVNKKIDYKNGGLKGSPKFPMPAFGEFLLQYHYLTGNKQALDAATIMLQRMASGSIYDHVGGGFARYATDTAWRVPHFEKMLYDNGQLVSLYAHAYQLTKDELFKNVAKETLAFVDRELSSPENGFYSSLNADTEGGEGVFYLWGYDEFQKILGPGDGPMTAEYFNVLPEGNWERHKNIVYTKTTAQEFGVAKKNPGFVSAVNKSKKRLLEERNKRPRPAVDTKILTSWNAIMLKACTDAFAAFGDSAYLRKALDNAAFMEARMLGDSGHLWRNYKDGKISVDGFLDDYAWLARAYIRLYQVTFDKHWLDLASAITGYAISHFYDNKSGMFFYTPASSLVARKMEIADNAIPSSNAIMAGVLYDLGVYFENDDFFAKSSGMLARVAGKINSMTSYYTQWCYVAGLFSHGTYEIAIMGKEAVQKNLNLQKNYLPACLYMGETDEENLPLLENKLPTDQTLIYVCTNRMCKLPVEEVEKAVEQMKKF